MKKFFAFIFILTSNYGNAQTPLANNTVRVNQQRIEGRIFELAKFGKDSIGKSNRVAFSKADQQGRAYFIGLMKKAGLEVNIDYAGNIIGKRKGKYPDKKPIAFGSHIDMVPDGGNYDGCVGSFGALEVMEVLQENKVVTEHPLELIIFADEEGGVIGSSALAGQFKPDALEVVSHSGLTIKEGIKAIGGNPDSLGQVSRKSGDLADYLELHIEQGGILEEEKIQIGVVEGIVGFEDWEVVVEGFANHAGTTPMNKRQDALLAASKFIIAVNEVITASEGRQVGTVGKISASPGASNVIPGRVVLSLEIRDLSHEKILKLFSDIEQRAAGISTSSNTRISFRNLNVGAMPAIMNTVIRNNIIASAKMLGYSYTSMPSGAGHDAQEMSRLAPTGMIFVPSIGGISHSPKEFTRAADMANGANVLLQTILLLDKN